VEYSGWLVDVVARAVGEDGVDEVGLHLGRRGPLAGEATRVAARDSSSKSQPTLPVLDVALMSMEDARTGFDSAAPRRVTPYSVSIPHTFGNAMVSGYRRGRAPP